ncbi:MAG: SDR family oxidoreductase [Bacteroidales bacterium]
MGQTSDIGAVAVWLASDEADYIHGTTIVVDVGMILYPGFTENG